MIVTPDIAANKLQRYLEGRLALSRLVDWAERALMNSQISETRFRQTRDALARLGLADVREFGLTWHDCRRILRSLGYDVHVKVKPKSRVGGRRG